MNPGSTAPPDDVIRALLAARPLVALIGASSKPERPSHQVMEALLAVGYDVIPVNPGETRVHGRRAYPDLGSIPRRVGLVDVFRRPEATPEVAHAAVAAGASVLWLQLGIVNAETARIARAGGLTVVMDRCTIVEHRRLIGAAFGRLGTAPSGPERVGLCRHCRHGREVTTPRSTFWLCQRYLTDPSFPKYPPLPVLACRGYEPSAGPANPSSGRGDG